MTSADNRMVPMPMDQSQGLCDLIGLAFRIWRRNLKLIFRALIVPTIVYFTTSTIVQWCLMYGVNSGFDLPKILALVALGVISTVLFIVSLVFLSLRQMALLRYFTGFASDWEKALAYSRKKVWWMLGLCLVSGLVSSVVVGIWVCVMVLSAAVTSAGPAGAVAGAIGLLVGMTGFFISLMLLMLLSVMGFSVLACEETTFWGVVGRSFHWTFRHFGRVLAFGCIFYIVFSVVSIPVSLPVLAASVAESAMRQFQSGGITDAKMSIGLLIFVQVWEAVCSLLLRPVCLLCFGLFYLDLRQRAEGLDMSRKLRELKAEFGATNELQGP